MLILWLKYRPRINFVGKLKIMENRQQTTMCCIVWLTQPCTLTTAHTVPFWQRRQQTITTTSAILHFDSFVDVWLMLAFVRHENEIQADIFHCVSANASTIWLKKMHFHFRLLSKWNEFNLFVFFSTFTEAMECTAFRCRPIFYYFCFGLRTRVHRQAYANTLRYDWW